MNNCNKGGWVSDVTLNRSVKQLAFQRFYQKFLEKARPLSFSNMDISIKLKQDYPPFFFPKKIRNDKELWEHMKVYIEERSL